VELEKSFGEGRGDILSASTTKEMDRGLRVFFLNKSMSESALQRLLQLGTSLPNATLRQEQRDLVTQLAQDLNITLDLSNGNHHEETTSPREEKKSPRDEINTEGVSSAREKFKRQERENGNNHEQPRARSSTLPARKSVSVRSPTLSNGTGNSDCDISSPAIKEAYDQVRDDNSPVNWISLGYGSSKKALELYGSGEGSLEEFTSSLKDDEVTFGYVRIIYGDSQRSKFVLISYVPDGLSILTKARATTHKPAVTQYLKYMHSDVYATTKAELAEDVIQAKLQAAAGANYGTGGTAAAGSEDFGSIKDNAKSFFQQTEGKGSLQSIVYHKGPLGEATPVSLQGRAGITEKYIKT